MSEGGPREQFSASRRPQDDKEEWNQDQAAAGGQRLFCWAYYIRGSLAGRVATWETEAIERMWLSAKSRVEVGQWASPRGQAFLSPRLATMGQLGFEGRTVPCQNWQFQRPCYRRQQMKSFPSAHICNLRYPRKEADVDCSAAGNWFTEQEA